MTDSNRASPTDDAERRIEAVAEEYLDELQAGTRADLAALLAAHADIAEPLRRRLALVERLFKTARGADGQRFPADQARRLKCPHCGNQIQLVEPRTKEVTCLNCGSSFRVEPGTTATFRPAGLPGDLGRFQIIELLGRGAFGEVYKARDTQLDRLVALKMPRTDYFATSEEAQRFLREARSAAGLRHSSIVQVHEIAHERGSPYIVSDFIEGLTLADLISGGRPGFRESAELVAQLADALDYAHRQKVIHRDIKPSNILLAAPQGPDAGGPRFVPYLTDFGLARRDEGEITVTLDGQVLGTPAYMSPEQAAGDHARVDGRSDVYSLGVVLYELLSGELPFRGSRRMLLHQVLHDEPRPPRTLNERIPRDLETICLKAMAKEPGRRYHTAADFRDDLRRFLRGDPIAARRVGPTERAWRWCRRNPAIAALAASLAAALVVGTAVSSYLAVTERTSRIAAETAEGHTLAAHKQTERVAARSLVVPLDPEALGGAVLSRPEREALWELATLRDDALSLRCIDEGTRDPTLTSALFARSEPAAIAAVGLNPTKRDRATDLLLKRVNDTSLSRGQRAEAAFFAFEFVEGPGPLADACTIAIREGMIGGQKPRGSTDVAWRDWRFWKARSHWEPHALAGLINALYPTDANSWFHEDDAADVLAANADRLDPAHAERSLKAALEHAKSSNSHWFLGRGLERLAERMQPADAARLRRDAAVAMSKAFGAAQSTTSLTPSFARASAKNAYKTLGAELAWPQVNPDDLVELTERIDPAEGAALLTEALNSASNASDCSVLGDGLAAAVARMDGAAREPLCAEAARMLISRIRTWTVDRTWNRVGGELKTLCKALAGVVRGIQGPNRVHICDEVAALLTEALKVRPDLFDELATAITTIAAEMPPSEAARTCRPAVDLLDATLDHETDFNRLCVLVEDIARLAAHLPDIEAPRIRAELAESLIGALRETKEWTFNDTVKHNTQVGIVHAVASLAAGMETEERAGFCSRAARELSRNQIWLLTPQIRPPEAAQLLTDALKAEPSADIRCSLAEQLGQVCVRLDREEATRVCNDAASLLIEGLRKATDASDLGHLGKGFSAVAAQMSVDAATPLRTEVASKLLETMQATSEGWKLEFIAQALLAVVAGIEGPQRAQIAAQAARTVLEARGRNDWSDDAAAVNGVTWPATAAALIEQTESRDAARLCATVGTELARKLATDAGDIHWNTEAGYALLKCLPYCDADTAANVAWLLAQSYCSEPSPVVIGESDPVREFFNEVLAEVPTKAAARDGSKSPNGCRLSTPQLVELLKMPTCFGAARRVILDHLERRYDRRFNTVWAFVRFAEEEKLGLDFTTPPVRPDPAKMRLPLP
jgi:serine/threonine protein kinase